ncbi:leucine-rich repeat protein [Butyrivibrio sp. INlla16]|uniref:leucine-rich repeat protein n=1 Tax=Butyrivibrio sp. INlla16 TaxID=1520807 RepID=UPI0008913E9B|nr:leucine-rich repeat protein [Butyrivibrio sp. INlla16]SDB21718.1 Leucine rich repeat-containing protein [Butyrivibrio sp. INlla16]
MKSIKRIESISLAILMIVACVFLMPALTAKAATTFTMDAEEPTGTKFKVDFSTDTAITYQQIEQCTCGFQQLVIDGDDLSPQEWPEIKQRMPEGYDDLYMYAPNIYLYNTDFTPGRCNGTLTIPIPSLNKKEEAYDARIICNFDMEEEHYEVIQPSSVTDKTISFNTFLLGRESGGNIQFSAHFYIAFKPHTHTWDEGTETKKATYTEDGVKTYKCTVCGETKTEVIPKLPVTNEAVQDAQAAAEYTFTIANDGTAEATFVKPTNKKAKKYTIPENVTLPDGSTAKVTQIGSKAFKDCSAKQITIPKTVKKIAAKAFEGSSAKTIILKTDAKGKVSIGKGAFKKLKTKKTTVKITGCKGNAKKKLSKQVKKQASSGTTVK